MTNQYILKMEYQYDYPNVSKLLNGLKTDYKQVIIPKSHFNLINVSK